LQIPFSRAPDKHMIPNHFVQVGTLHASGVDDRGYTYVTILYICVYKQTTQ
jgi:hypothetical protein